MSKIERMLIEDFEYPKGDGVIQIDITDLRDIVDEMRKDFPKFKQFELPTINGIEIDWKTACKMMEAQIIKRENWYNKWLVIENE